MISGCECALKAFEKIQHIREMIITISRIIPNVLDPETQANHRKIPRKESPV